MIKKSLYFTILCFINLSLTAQSISNKQQEEILLAAKSFTSALSLYSNCNGTNEASLGARVLSHKDGDDPKNYFMNDFFRDGEDFIDPLDWFRYLRYIDEKYDFNLQVDFKNFEFINCIASTNGSTYAIVSVEKEIIFGDRKTKLIQLLFINTSNYLITEIISPEFYKQNKGQCTNAIASRKSENNDELNNLKKLADESFTKRDYINAKNYYLAALNKAPDLIALKTQIEACESYITLSTIMNHADALLSEKKYDEASTLYQKILSENTVVNKYAVTQKIALCKAEITNANYNRNISYADEFYNKGIFNKAKEFYSLALNYKPNDSYASSQLEKSRRGDPSFVRSEIRRAIGLIEKDPVKNGGVGFEILLNNEQSGLLTTENYIFFTMSMDGNDRISKNIRRYMNYDKKTARNYAQIFIYKLKKAVNNETNPAILERALNVYNRSINSNNQ